MRVEQFGDGTPEIAIVGGIHGDEPCGVHAVEHLVEDDPRVDRPVKLIIANEPAVEKDVRYVERDLNRVFPTGEDPEPIGDSYEERLAVDLLEELRGCLVLAMHSTQSHPQPFAIVDDPDDEEVEICVRLPVAAAVESGAFSRGRLLAATRAIEVECGYQGSDMAADNAVEIAWSFLRATGVLPNEPPPRELPYYRLVRQIPKSEAVDYEVYAENFRPVARGQPYAAVDGRPLLADEAFVPVLVSPYGYEQQFGYAAEQIGTLP